MKYALLEVQWAARRESQGGHSGMKWSDGHTECVGDFIVAMVLALVSLAQKFFFARLECSRRHNPLRAVHFPPVQSLRGGPVIWSMPAHERREPPGRGAFAMREGNMRWM